MEFALDQQALRPITNEVEVLNGQAFRDVVLQPRIQPLLEAQTAQQLLERIDVCELSLGAFGVKPRFSLEKSTSAASGDVLSLRTVVDLRETRPDHRFLLTSRIDRDLYNLHAKYQASNRFKFGELSEISATIQPEPQTLAAGSASIASPLPLGRSLLALKGFFFNEDRVWASHSLASHGVAAELRVPLGARGLFRGGGQAVARHIHSIRDTAGDAVRAAAGTSSLKVSLLAELSHANERESGVSHAVRALLEVAGAPGDTQHLKSVVDGSLRLPLAPNNELELVCSGQAGYIHAEHEKLRICDNFLIGGPPSLLGFARNSVGPRDANDFVGGQAFYTSRLALLAKLPFQPRSPLKLKAQLDSGVLRAHSGADWQSNVHSLLGESAAVSSAAGLTYYNERAKFDVLWVMPLHSGAGDRVQGGLHVGAELSLM